MIWKDEHMIDTLAVAYAEIGDFNSAVQYGCASAGCERSLARQHKTFSAAPCVVSTAQANSLVTAARGGAVTRSLITANLTECMIVSDAHRFTLACRD